jgi:hypothetical protein
MHGHPYSMQDTDQSNGAKKKIPKSMVSTEQKIMICPFIQYAKMTSLSTMPKVEDATTSRTLWLSHSMKYSVSKEQRQQSNQIIHQNIKSPHLCSKAAM